MAQQLYRNFSVSCDMVHGHVVLGFVCLFDRQQDNNRKMMNYNKYNFRNGILEMILC